MNYIGRDNDNGKKEKIMKKMEIFYLLLILLAISFVSMQAAYLKNEPVEVMQPDGKVLNLFVSGDEFYNWLHDKEGYTIITDPQTGYYVYAIQSNGKLQSSNLFPDGSVDPSTLGIERNLQVAPEKRLSAKELFPQPDGPRNAPSKGTINNIIIFTIQEK